MDRQPVGYGYVPDSQGPKKRRQVFLEGEIITQVTRGVKELIG
jgi:hypothetical protein